MGWIAGAAIYGLAAVGPAQAQDVSAYPTYGEVFLSAGFVPDPHREDVVAGGEIDASDTIGGACWGYIADAPDLTLDYEAGDYSLYISARSYEDTTLAVRNPDGVWECNDDYDGFDPAVTFANPMSGRYHIWVGTFSEMDDLPDATVLFSEIDAGDSAAMGGGLDYTLEPNFGSVELTAGFADDPYTVELLAGGSVAVTDYFDHCRGYASEAPDYSIQYEAGDFLPLYISATSDTDTTLIVNDPNGEWVCDDDGGEGVNPQVVFESPTSGRYDVWVGTYFGVDDFADATLAISELGRTAAPRTTKTPRARLDATLPPTYGMV
jgi:hypothetical protein